MTNDDGLQAGEQVSMEDYERVVAEHWRAQQLVRSSDYADLPTALAAVRGG